MADPSIQAAVVEVLRNQLGLDEVDPQALIVEELGAESSDIVNIIASVEERFAIEIAESELPDIRNVADLVAVVEHYSSAA